MNQQPESAPTIIKPDRIEWRPVGQFRIDGRRVYIGDSWMIGCGDVDAPVTPGVYDIDIKIHYYGSDDRVALLRGRLVGSKPDGERLAGEFGVDVASAGVIDADAYDRWHASDEKATEVWQEKFSAGQTGDYADFFPCEQIGSSMLYTSTGFGDGGYNAVTLVEGDRPVGFELRFLSDEGYSNEPVRPALTLKERAWIAVLLPITIIVAIPVVILGLVSRWSNKFLRMHKK
ncbi:MAG: hypothetical protein SF172_16955 [Burkholderiales bacterium]|nr:hypothetical protein [Burkholderiales bacterium]